MEVFWLFYNRNGRGRTWTCSINDPGGDELGALPLSGFSFFLSSPSCLGTRPMTSSQRITPFPLLFLDWRLAVSLVTGTLCSDSMTVWKGSLNGRLGVWGFISLLFTMWNSGGLVRQTKQNTTLVVGKAWVGLRRQRWKPSARGATEDRNKKEHEDLFHNLTSIRATVNM